MPIIDLFESSEHRNNIAHFAAIVYIAAIDGAINSEEETFIKSFAIKLNITDNEYKDILKDPKKYPLQPPYSYENRLKRIYDLFKTIYSDYKVDELEMRAILQYAIGLGCSISQAEDIVARSATIFSGAINFEDYRYLIDNRK